MSTEGELRDWRGGQTNSERLAAGVLAVEGFRAVDPQAPLGGPDDKKDILARRDDIQWLAGVFFPPTRQTFRQVRNKFDEDLLGVEQHKAGGFAFFVNQPLTLDERKGLHGRCDVDLEIYYLERLRAILDSPKGYGLRLEFPRDLHGGRSRLPSSAHSSEDITQRLLANERHVTDMAAKVDVILERTTAIAQALTSEPSSLSIRFDAVGEARRPTSELDVATVLLIHRLISEGTPAEPTAGQLRAVQVWIGSPDDPVYVPCRRPRFQPVSWI